MKRKRLNAKSAVCMCWYFFLLFQVIPLRLKDELPTRLKKEKIFCVKQSWDGKCFRVLSPDTFSMLNEANKKGDGIPNSVSSFVPSEITSSVKKETKKVAWSAPKTKNVEMEIESKHSASKSSLSKKRHSLRIDNGTKNPTARKKLDLSSMYMSVCAFCPFGCFECSVVTPCRPHNVCLIFPYFSG